MAKYDKICEEAYLAAKKETAIQNRLWLDSPWSGFFDGKDPMELLPTGVSEDTLQHIGTVLSTEPGGEFVVHNGGWWFCCQGGGFVVRVVVLWLGCSFGKGFWFW